MYRILLISTGSPEAKPPKVLDDFTHSLNQRSDAYEFDYAMVQNLLFAVTDGVPSITYNGKDIAETYACIHLRNHDKYADYANTIRLYADARGIRLVNRGDAVLPYYGKLSQGFLFAFNGIPTPDLITAFDNPTLLAELKRIQWQFPFVVKHNYGIKGIDNYLIHDMAALETVLDKDKHGFIAQPYMRNDGELRILTFGSGHEPLIFRKTAVGGRYLNNTSQGGTAELVVSSDVSKVLLADAMKAARLTKRDIGGVDVLLTDGNGHMVLEVNTTPAIASGVFQAEKADRYYGYFEKTD